MNNRTSKNIGTILVLIWLSTVVLGQNNNIQYPEPNRPPMKLALLVGINNYEYNSVSNLKGAVNDVYNMRHLLTSKYQFPEENIDTLLNNQATHMGIIKTFEKRLIHRAQRDDIVVFYYSGHGSRMPDVSGDEVDSLDETIVPYDSRDPEGKIFDISDDQINGLLYALSQRTKNITFIFDSCHSGSGVRGNGTPRNVPPDTARGLPPANPPYARSIKNISEGASDLRSKDLDYVLISGAAFNQQAQEKRISGKGIQGLLTHHLVEALWNANTAVTYQDVMDNVIAKVEVANSAQTPQLEGSREHHYVFSDSLSIARPYILAKPRQGKPQEVVLAAGKIQGLTVGSKFKIYSAGTKDFNESVPFLAKIELTKVRNYQSYGKIIEGERFPAQSRAVEYEHHYGEKQLYLHYANLDNSRMLRTIKDSLDQFNFINPENHADGYHIQLMEKNHSIFLEVNGAVAQAKQFAFQDNTVALVVAEVTNWTRWFNLLSIENPSPPFAAEFKLSAFRGGETRSPFDYISGEAKNVFYPNEQISFSIRNISDRHLFFTILDLASDNTINLIYQSTQSLPPGQSWQASTGVSVPEGHQAITDIVKVFLTTRKLDFKTLLQAPLNTRGEKRDPPDDPLAQLFANALSGTRGDRTTSTVDWNTVQRVITVKKRN